MAEKLGPACSTREKVGLDSNQSVHDVVSNLPVLDGGIYSGAIWNGLKHGKGVLQDQNGTVVYNGYFFYDFLHGPGASRVADCVHNGFYYASEKHGYGRTTNAAGDMYEGLFRGGKFFGPGIVTQSDGSVSSGLWLADHLIQVPLTFKDLYAIPYLQDVLPVFPPEPPLTWQPYKAIAAQSVLDESDLAVETSPAVRGFQLNGFRVGQPNLEFETILEHQFIKSLGCHGSEPPLDTRRLNDVHTLPNPGILLAEMHKFATKLQLLSDVHKELGDRVAGESSRTSPAAGKTVEAEQFATACVEGETVRLHELKFRRNVNVDVCDAEGYNPLMIASLRTNLNVMAFLLDFGANLNHMTNRGHCVIELCFVMYTCYVEKFNMWQENDPDIASIFIPKPLPPPPKDTRTASSRKSPGELRTDVATPSRAASAPKPRSVTPTKALREQSRAGAVQVPEPEINLAEDQKGSFKSQQTLKKVQIEVKVTDFTRVAIHLSQYIHKVDLMTKPQVEKPVFLAWLKKWQERMKYSIMLLLRRKANWRKCTWPMPILFSAVRGIDADLVRLLLSLGAPVNDRISREGKSVTPLLVACAMYGPGVVEVVEALLAAGADPNAPEYDLDAEGNPNHKSAATARRPVHIVCQRDVHDRHTEQLLDLLIRYKARCDILWNHGSPLVFAIKQGNVQMVRSLLAAGCDINKDLGDNHGNALCVMATLGMPDGFLHTNKDFATIKQLLKLLLSHNADFTVKVPMPDGLPGSALDYALQLFKYPLSPTLDPKFRAALEDLRNTILDAYREGMRVSVMRHRKIALAGTFYPQVMDLLKQDPQLIDAADPLIEPSLSPSDQIINHMMVVVRKRIEELLSADVIKDGQKVRPTLKIPFRKGASESKKGKGARSAVSPPGSPPLTMFKDDTYMEDHVVHGDNYEDEDPFVHEKDDPDHVTLLIPAVHLVDEDSDEMPLDPKVTEYKYCSFCFISGGNSFFLCPKCVSLFYCSKDHQLAHWPAHRAKCAELCRRRLHAEKLRKKMLDKKNKKKGRKGETSGGKDGKEDGPGGRRKKGGTGDDDTLSDGHGGHGRHGKHGKHGHRSRGKKGRGHRGGKHGDSKRHRGRHGHHSSRNGFGRGHDMLRAKDKSEADWMALVRKMNRLQLDQEMMVILSTYYEQLMRSGLNLAVVQDIVELKNAEFYTALSQHQKKNFDKFLDFVKISQRRADDKMLPYPLIATKTFALIKEYYTFVRTRKPNFSFM